MKNKFFNSLGLKLLLVNLIAPLMLISGMFLMNDYEKALKDAEFKSIETKAELIALSFDNYYNIMTGIAKLSGLRAQIFYNDGSLIADSKMGQEDKIISLSDLVVSLTEGRIVKNINIDNNIMDIIIPVYDMEGYVKGAVRVYSSTKSLEKTISDMNTVLYSLFGATLFTTIILSLFFARTIISPLNELADISNQIEDRNKQIIIPDFRNRKDEIGKLSLAFRAMLEKIQEKLFAFERFSSDVSHEIKNPLTSILNASQAVQKINDNEKKDKLLAIIFDDVERLNRLITDISNISKTSAEIENENLEPIKIIPLIENLSQVYQFNEKNQKIIIEYDKKFIDVEIMALETRISQIFNNLISNAMSFSSEKSVIIVKIEIKKSILFISVIDNGKGIEKGTETKIFERFYQNRDESENHKHSGLGLSLTKEIVENLQGKIYASHNKPTGAIFTIEFPIKK